MEERLALLTPTFTRKDQGKGKGKGGGAEANTAPQTGVNQTVIVAAS